MRGARNGTAPRSSSSTATGSEPPPAWLTATVDQLHAATQGFDPSRAREVVAVMEHYPTLLEAMADFAERIGRQSVDSVDLPPAAQEMFLSLGSIQRKCVAPARDGLTAARRMVEDRIARYREGRPQDEAWDVGKNKQ